MTEQIPERIGLPNTLSRDRPASRKLFSAVGGSFEENCARRSASGTHSAVFWTGIQSRAKKDAGKGISGADDGLKFLWPETREKCFRLKSPAEDFLTE